MNPLGELKRFLTQRLLHGLRQWELEIGTR